MFLILWSIQNFSNILLIFWLLRVTKLITKHIKLSLAVNKIKSIHPSDSPYVVKTLFIVNSYSNTGFVYYNDACFVSGLICREILNYWHMDSHLLTCSNSVWLLIYAETTLCLSDSRKWTLQIYINFWLYYCQAVVKLP